LAEVVLLGVAAGLMLLRPGGLPFWVGPVAAASVGVVTTIVDLDTVGDALDPMAAPLLFLVFAVPLAVALDRLGVFAALAALVDGGRHLALALWVFGAVVVIVFNLDAAVLLLTPLYIRIAGRHGYAPEAFAFQPAMLACLASGLLPVSNLTNLIVAEQFDLGVVDFVRAMWLPTVVAVAVGFAAYRRVFDGRCAGGCRSWRSCSSASPAVRSSESTPGSSPPWRASGRSRSPDMCSCGPCR
jgi:arsenical pump membrane protein